MAEQLCEHLMPLNPKCVSSKFKMESLLFFFFPDNLTHVYIGLYAMGLDDTHLLFLLPCPFGPAIMPFPF